MTSRDAKSGGTAVLVGLVAGYLAYQRKSDADKASLSQGVCASAPPGSLQSLGAAIQGAESHYGEDAAIGSLAIFDLVTKFVTDGYVNSDLASQFYGWYHGLTPDQQKAVTVTEDGNLVCAAAETVQQIATGTSSLAEAVLVGAIAYVAASALLEDS